MSHLCSVHARLRPTEALRRQEACVITVPLPLRSAGMTTQVEFAAEDRTRFVMSAMI